MTSKTLNTIFYIVTGVTMAIYWPIGFALAVKQLQPGVHPIVLVGICVVVIYLMMSISIGAMSVLEAADWPERLGPSAMAGLGQIGFYMAVVPFLVGPGLVWLYILPFDEMGRIDKHRLFSYSMDGVEVPNHG